MQIEVMAKLKNRVYAFSMNRKSDPSIILTSGIVVSATKVVAHNLVREHYRFTDPQDIRVTLRRVKKNKSQIITDINTWVKPKKIQPHEKTVNLG